MQSTSPENILLRLAREHEQQVVQIYAELAHRGFPLQHQRPHVTVTFAHIMQTRVVGEAAVALPPLLPARLERAGTVMFGTKRKQTVAWLLEAPDALDDAARRLSAMNPDGRGPRWIPHLTMGLRLPKAMVPAYVEALAEVTNPHLRSLTVEVAAFYQPRLGAELVL